MTPASVKVYAKRLMAAALLLLLMLPAAQAKFEWFPSDSLEGYYEGPAPHPELSWEALTSNTYQPALERYLEDRLGFRVWFIKWRGQVPYSLFHETKDPNIFVGRNGVLFDSRPLYAYIGKDPVEEAALQRHIRHLRVVQDTLARRGKLFLFVTAASKASFAPEDMPTYFRKYPRQASNYERYTAAMRKAGINLFDLSHIVRQWKDTASYPLFPPYGTHWSNYTATLAGDTLVRYLEGRLGQDLRDYRLLPGEISDQARDQDEDLLKPLNLPIPPPPRTMKYPQVEYLPLKPGQRRPTALLIGDSFVFTILYNHLQHVFDDKASRFWFYNVINQSIVWPGELPEGNNMKVLDRRAQYLARDIVLVMFTEYNMDQHLDYGFSDDAYKLFVPYSHTDSLKVSALAKQIAQRPVPKDYWWAKGVETGMSMDQLVRQAAEAKYDSLR
ncbi:hypothetical protein F0P96_14075 [Hymenobacter busanensis]|uniref:Uncharacterized protein n=1 Tax=Hymenobacter busanensis TaxID=2607656 RepID=A0A7L5A012_9BACT|nr:hypothetical protein [Hymenobacter busanensis]KAA9331370.1 hypothetical protein F0P96_14075 [Hymenobacter busanensis]QHJ08523.1 hypothetical protein GUY19_15000 [Hymenobacter busanensis]